MSGFTNLPVQMGNAGSTQPSGKSEEAYLYACVMDNLNDGVAPAARLQDRACHFLGTRFLGNPIPELDTPSRGGSGPELLQLRLKSHRLAQPTAGV